MSHEPVPYGLLSTVQELDALFHRHCLTTPPDQLLTVHAAEPAVLPAALDEFAGNEELLRGAGCLLANGFGAAVLPVLVEALQCIRRLDESLTGKPPAAVAQYYAALEAALTAQPRTSAEFYWLCGEALGLYLDVLAMVHDSAELRAETARLRGLLQSNRGQATAAAG